MYKFVEINHYSRYYTNNLTVKKIGKYTSISCNITDDTINMKFVMAKVRYKVILIENKTQQIKQTKSFLFELLK